MESLKKRLDEFSHERFNEQYRNLIGITLDIKNEGLEALNFISDCQALIEDLKENLKKLPEERHCPYCQEKGKIIELKDEKIKILNDKLYNCHEKLVTYLEEEAGINKVQNLKICNK